MSAFLNAFDELSQALAAQSDQVAMLPLELIDEDPGNPRDRFDDGELQALAATIAERGVLQPIVVRPADGTGRYRLRFGARRLRAARLAGREAIPALIRQGAPTEIDSLIEQVIENDQRAALSTAELARTVSSLQDLGLSQAEIGARLGRSKDHIAMLAAVRAMPPKLQGLASTLGVRTLYELHQAWRGDPASAEAWIEAQPPGEITQAQARVLAATARAATRAVSPTRGSPKAPPEVHGSLRIEVQVGGRRGRLELRAGPTPQLGFVRFEGQAGLAAVELGSVSLVRMALVSEPD